MKFGERQVETKLEDIRRDHVARYEWVAKNIANNCRVIDLACGVGYGANILANAGHRVLAIDKDVEALNFANRHWMHKDVEFGMTDAATLDGKIGEFDIAVSFETIEHIEDPMPLLKSLRLSAEVLIASVPNEEVIPYSWVDDAGKRWTTEFHHRHYTKAEFEQLLNETGWIVEEWYGQLGPESEVEKDVNGRTLIAICSRGRITPDHVVILGLGPSLDEYTNIVKRAGNRKSFSDEVWAINMLGGIFDCDMCFHMDDMKIQEIRAEARPDSNIANMVAWIRESKVPVMTSRLYPEYPALVEFPIEEVMNNLKYDYFNSTAAYAVAYAIFLGVKKITLFGCDYTYPNAHDAEKGRACVEFWLGMAAERGISISVPKKSSLMDAMYSQQERFYGYDTRTLTLTSEDGKISVGFTDVETLPTADEIEVRYDHSAHPNKIVEDNK